jgi:exonuclease VII small subunit
MKKEEVLFLNQLIRSLEEGERSLERSYEKRDYDNFNKSKKIMLRIQKEISNIIK